MRRRSLGCALLLGVLGGATLAEAQPARSPAMVGLLCVGSGCPAPPLEVSVPAFLTTLREAGYVDGQNVVVDLRGIGDVPAQLPGLAPRAFAKVLKGRRPADIPVEQPTRYELIVNLATAKTIGVTIPPGVLAGADEILQ